MENNVYIQVLLTLLTIATGITAILSFANTRRRSYKSDDERTGQLHADINYIKSLLIDVRQETKEMNDSLNNHSERLARVEESCKQAHKRLTEMEQIIRGDK